MYNNLFCKLNRISCKQIRFETKNPISLLIPQKEQRANVAYVEVDLESATCRETHTAMD